MKRREAGFTLTELMIVVAIIGILVTMAIVYLRPRPRPIDVANRVGDLVREGSRRAIALGPVRSDVVAQLGIRARTRITAALSGTKDAPTVTFTLSLLHEGRSGEADWNPVMSYTTDPRVVAVEWRADVVAYTAPPSTDLWSAFESRCSPDGTCQARTLFFQASLGDPDCTPREKMPPVYEICAKLAIMPLGGAITTRADWN